MPDRDSRLPLAVAGAVLVLGLLAYWPALDNPFIADDYALMLGAERAAEPCTALFEMPLGWRRLVSNFFFTVCFALFGPQAWPFYLVNLLLHLSNSFLVFLLVQSVASDRRAAAAAALFFVAYERHQEPMFWIGAQHELLLALGVVGATLAFLRYRRRGRWGWYGLAFVLFLVTAFTKESFLVLPPLLLLADWWGRQKRPEPWWRAHTPFWLAAAAYGALMYVGPWRYLFANTQSGFTLHFFEVYLRSLNRLLLFVYPFLGLAWLVSRAKKEALGGARRGRAFLFFAGWLLVAIAPYSFILYDKQLPSRHSYVASVAVAALVGLLFAFVWERAASRGGRLIWAALLVLLLAGNVAYIWRKDVQYVELAAPTEQLIAAVNHYAHGLPNQPPAAVVVYDFPYPSIVGRGAVHFFAEAQPARLIFHWPKRKMRPPPPGALHLRWNPQTRVFDTLASPLAP